MTLEIDMYGAKWCSFCVKQKQWFLMRKIDFNYKDIEIKNHEEELSGYNVSSIPFLVLKNNETKEQHTIEGFNPEAIQQFIRKVTKEERSK